MARRVVDDILATILGHLELAGMEARDAANALAHIAVMAGLAVMLLASTWFMLVAAGIIGLLAVGVHPVLALAAAAIVTLGAGLVLIVAIRPRLGALQFPATLRQLRLAVDAHATP